MNTNPTPNGWEHGVADTAPPTRDLPAGRHEFHKERLMALIDQDNRTTAPAPEKTRRASLLRPRFAVAAFAAAAVAAVAAVAVPALMPSPADRAVASWTPTATELAGAKVLSQATACAQDWGTDSAQASDVLVAQQRGVATALIMKFRDGLRECLVTDLDDVWSWQQLTDGPVPALAPGAVTTSTWSSRGEGDGQFSHITGQVGSDVAGIDVVLNNGTTVQTMTGGGWWTAWWPGPDGGEVDTFKVAVRTAAGVKTYSPQLLHK